VILQVKGNTTGLLNHAEDLKFNQYVYTVQFQLAMLP
jgi:hypothetical protein